MAKVLLKGSKMPNFIVLDGNNIVSNVIVAESLEIAQQVCGGLVIEQTEEHSCVNPGMIWDGNFFINSEV